MSVADQPAARLEQKGGESDGREAAFPGRRALSAAWGCRGAHFFGGHAVPDDIPPNVADSARHAFKQARALGHQRQARIGGAHR